MNGCSYINTAQISPILVSTTIIHPSALLYHYHARDSLPTTFFQRLSQLPRRRLPRQVPTTTLSSHLISFPLAMSYTDDLQSGSYTPPICTWCNSSPKSSNKWGGSLSSPNPTTLYNGVPDGWNMVLPMARSNHHHHHPSTTILPYPNEYRSYPSSPGSATDLSPSTYSEAKGYFDFIPIQNTQYDHTNSAPISPGSLSVHGSDNDLTPLDTPPMMSRELSSTYSELKRCIDAIDSQRRMFSYTKSA